MIFKIAKIGLLAIILNSIIFIGCSVDNSADAELRKRYEYSIDSIRMTMGGIEPSLNMAMTSMLYMHMNRNLSYNSLHFKGLSSALFDPNIGLILFGISPKLDYSKIVIYKLDNEFNIVNDFEKVIEIDEKVIEHPWRKSSPNLLFFRLYFTTKNYPDLVDFFQNNNGNFSVGIAFRDGRVTNLVPLVIGKNHN